MHTCTYTYTCTDTDTHGGTCTGLSGGRTQSPAGEQDPYLAVLDAAKARARELRTQAVGDFWDDADALARRALRSATRFAQRLSRHARA